MKSEGIVDTGAHPRLPRASDIDTMIAALNERLLSGLRLYITVGIGVLCVIAAIEILTQRVTWALPVLFVCNGMLAVAAWSKRSALVVRELLCVAGATGIPGVALLHFGPQLGVGVFFVLAIVIATAFFGTRGSVVVLTVIMGFVTLLWAGTQHGFVHPNYVPDDPNDWVRIVLTTICAGATSTYLANHILEAMRSAMFAKRSAELAEEAAQRSREKTYAEREQTQQERERLLRQSLESQQLESIGRLASGVAHEFNNALMIIQSGVEFLQSHDLAAAQAKDTLAAVGRAATGAAETSKQLLAYARSRPEDAGTCFPAEVIATFRGSFSRMLPESITLDVQANTTPAIGTSASTLEQVLLNLLLNARDAMPTGGAIVLQCTVDPTSHDTVVRVRDTGAGISDDVKARIFEPFFTTKKDRGTGLGLAMVWGVVTRAGGTITVDSKLGEGTIFSLHFPAVAVAAAPASTALVTTKGDGSMRRVLLVEDEPDVLEAVTRMLAMGKYTVTAFARAQPAIDSLATERYDVLVTDVVVPDGGIPELIAAFRTKHPNAPTLVCSGHVDEELVNAGIEAGDYQFLRKPFSTVELLERIGALVSG